MSAVLILVAEYPSLSSGAPGCDMAVYLQCLLERDQADTMSVQEVELFRARCQFTCPIEMSAINMVNEVYVQGFGRDKSYACFHILLISNYSPPSDN